MEQLKKDELIEAYREVYDAIPQEAVELDLRVTIKTIQALAKGKPVSPNELAIIWEMPLEQVQSVLTGAVAAGRAEIDSQGRLDKYYFGAGNWYRNARCGRDVLYSPHRCFLLGMISNSGGEDLAFVWIDKLLPTKIIGVFRRL